MKTPLLSLLSLALLQAATAQQKTVTTVSPNALYDAGLHAITKGDYANAQKYLTAAKAARHPMADYQLTELSKNRGSLVATKRKITFGTIKIDKVDYTEADFADSIKFLATKITEVNKDYTPNFVIRDPENKLQGKTVTLQLNNVPASVILDQMLSMASAKAKFEEHTIVIQPQ
jgi:hypothetical protein